MSSPQVPSTKECIYPVFKALHELGGSASTKDIDQCVIKKLKLNEAQLAQRRGNGQLVIKNNAAFARERLKSAGLIYRPKRATWSLTEKGRNIFNIDTDQVMRESNEYYKQNKATKSKPSQLEQPPKPKYISKAIVAKIQYDARQVLDGWFTKKFVYHPSGNWKEQPGAKEFVVYYLRQQGHPIPDDWPNGDDGIPTPPEVPTSDEDITHDEIQWKLLAFGSQIDKEQLDLWVAKGDQKKSFQGNRFSDIRGVKQSLPGMFDKHTRKIIEYIDVLWLSGFGIVAALEIEHTTSIYSGLLRMSDLVTLMPGLRINLYIVAPDKRRDKVKSEINRPTFSNLKLPVKCKYIAYSKFLNLYQKHSNALYHLHPSIIGSIAEDMSK